MASRPSPGDPLPLPPVPDELQPADKASPKKRSEQLGLDLKPVRPAGISFTSEERAPKRACTSPNFEVRITDALIKKLEEAADHAARLITLGDAMRPTGRIILPGEFELERDGIYERLAHELGLPKPPPPPASTTTSDSSDTPSILEGI